MYHANNNCHHRRFDGVQIRTPGRDQKVTEQSIRIGFRFKKVAEIHGSHETAPNQSGHPSEFQDQWKFALHQDRGEHLL